MSPDQKIFDFFFNHKWPRVMEINDFLLFITFFKQAHANRNWRAKINSKYIFFLRRAILRLVITIRLSIE